MRILDKIESIFLSVARTTAILTGVAILWSNLTVDIDLANSILESSVLLIIISAITLSISTILKIPSYLKKGE